MCGPLESLTAAEFIFRAIILWLTIRHQICPCLESILTQGTLIILVVMWCACAGWSDRVCELLYWKNPVESPQNMDWLKEEHVSVTVFIYCVSK